MGDLIIVYRVFLDDLNNVGIKQKMIGQQEGYEQHGYKTHRVYLTRKGVLLNDNLFYERKLNNPISIFYYLTHSFYQDVLSIVRKMQPKFIHWRHFPKSKNTVSCLKKIKEIHQPTILYELPTYPYEGEQLGFFRKYLLRKDLQINLIIGDLLDRIIHYGEERNIWGVDTISIQNGVREKSLKVGQKSDDEIRFVAIGKLWNWWGLDLFFEAMARYIQTDPAKKIKLWIFGSGPEEKRLKLNAINLGLSNQIKFFGPMSGNEYEKLVHQTNIGVGILGMSRKNMDYSSALKHREYASFGLPFLYRGKDNDFDHNQRNYRIGNGPVSISSIIEDYSSHSDWRDYSKALKIEVKERLIWREKLRPVIDFLESRL